MVNVSIPSNWILAFPKSSYQAWDRKSRYATHRKVTVSRAKWPFSPVGGGGVVVLTAEFRCAWVILGVNGPILAHFRQKIVSHLWISRLKNVFYCIWYGNFRRGSFNDGNSPSMTTSIQFGTFWIFAVFSSVAV